MNPFSNNSVTIFRLAILPRNCYALRGHRSTFAYVTKVSWLPVSFRAANLLHVGLLYREDRAITALLNVAYCSTNGTALLEPSLNHRLSKQSIYLNTNLLHLPVTFPDRRFTF